jgi:ABC-type spermidine/putrescine transport system permease subunit II
MSIYTLVLFVHIVGALGIFTAIGIWLFAAAALRRAQQVAQVRALAGLTVASGNVAVGGVVLLAAAGLYMALTTWGWQTAWIDVATASFLLLAPFGGAVIDPRMRALARAADDAPDGPLPASLRARTHDPVVGIGLHIYICVLLGIVFLMTTKPTLIVSLLAMAVATLLGLASALPLTRAARVQSPTVAGPAGRT